MRDRFADVVDACRRLDGALAFGIAVSVVLHGALLGLRFSIPDATRFSASASPLEIVLLNARTDRRPRAPDVLAQVDMEAGGEHARGRATSPLPAQRRASDGTALRERGASVARLEARQAELLALAGTRQPVPPASPAPVDARADRAAEPGELEAAIARLQAQIDRQISDYNKRPRRLTYGINARGVAWARYVDDWAARIERVGTEHFPPEARGRMYDSMIVTVEIDRAGRVVDVVVNRKSRFDALNRAIPGIVRAGEPYPPFPPEMAREGDILQIVRTWTFTHDTLATRPATAP